MPALSLEEMLRSSLDNVNREFQSADQALFASEASLFGLISLASYAQKANFTPSYPGLLYHRRVENAAHQMQVTAVRIPD